MNMKDNFFDKKVDYFFEYEYSFVNDFLKSIYGNKIIRRYSLGGDGIFNLLYLDDSLYELRFKEIKKMLINDGKSAFRDSKKDEIVKTICDNLKEGTEYTVNSGKFISFKLGNYIAQIEIVKKTKEPDNLGKVRIDGIWV